MDINKIAQVGDGVFESVLDFPDQNRLIDLLVDRKLPLVLMVDVQIGNYTWQHFTVSGFKRIEGMCRSISGDFLVSTDEFMSLHEKLSWRWALQIECSPPDYFEFNKITGKQRYQILKKCGFRFILESQPGGGDRALVVTQSRNLLQQAIDETTV